jgi:hypothetical protein
VTESCRCLCAFFVRLHAVYRYNLGFDPTGVEVFDTTWGPQVRSLWSQEKLDEERYVRVLIYAYLDCKLIKSLVQPRNSFLNFIVLIITSDRCPTSVSAKHSGRPYI